MSELKSRHVIDVYDYYAEKPCEERSQVYLKSEVDASIDELKQKLAEKESWVKMLGEGEAALSLELEKTKRKLEDAKATAYTDIRHQKYKRSLTMAIYCDASMAYFGEFYDDASKRMTDFYYKWCDRWYRIAMRFKEMK